MDTLDFHAMSDSDLIKKLGYPECPKK